MEEPCTRRYHTMHLFLWGRCRFLNYSMVIWNKFTMNLEFTNLFSSTSVKTYDCITIKISNSSHSKNKLQFFCILMSWALYLTCKQAISACDRYHIMVSIANSINNQIFCRYFLKILVILLSPPFYSSQIRPSKVSNPIPNYILNDSKFFPFFKDALGAIDGSHHNVYTSTSD